MAKVRWGMLVLLVTLVSSWATESTADEEREYLRGFSDGINHWRKKWDRSDPPVHASQEIKAIADNILLYQRANGGWPPNEDPLRVLTQDEMTAIKGDREKADTSFDNRTTYTHIRYLAHAFEQTGDDRYRVALEQGLDFLLTAQYPTGGWPHSHPNHQGYRGHITIMDDVMVGILQMLREASHGDEPFRFLEPRWRDRCARALELGDACLLHMQVRVDGKPTVWAGQYDPVTLEPMPGRSFELVGLVSAESAQVLRYLMSIPEPSDEIVRSIEAGASWFERSRILGIRIDRVEAATERFPNHTSRDDRVQVADPSAPPIWARFYDIQTNEYFLADRDGVRVRSLDQLGRERRTGYSWFGYYGKELLERDYPRWRDRKIRPRGAG